MDRTYLSLNRPSFSSYYYRTRFSISRFIATSLRRFNITKPTWLSQLQSDDWQYAPIPQSIKTSRWKRQTLMYLCIALAIVLFLSIIWFFSSRHKHSDTTHAHNGISYRLAPDLPDGKVGRVQRFGSKARKALVIASFSGQEVSWLSKVPPK